MKEFELKLGATTYKCTSNASNKTDQNWHISAKFHDLSIRMEIPIESKVSMDKVLVFISSLDEALKTVQNGKKKRTNIYQSVNLTINHNVRTKRKSNGDCKKAH